MNGRTVLLSGLFIIVTVGALALPACLPNRQVLSAAAPASVDPQPATLPTDWLPAIGGVAFGAFVAVVLEAAKILGLHQKHAPAVTIAAGALWAAAALALDLYPQAQPWIVWAINTVMAVANVPVFSRLTYKHAIQPAARERWNRPEEHRAQL